MSGIRYLFLWNILVFLLNIASQFNGNWLCWENVYTLKYLLLKVFNDIEKIKFISCHNLALHFKIEKFCTMESLFLGVEVELRMEMPLIKFVFAAEVEINCLRNLCLPLGEIPSGFSSATLNTIDYLLTRLKEVESERMKWSSILWESTRLASCCEIPGRFSRWPAES